MKTNHTTSLLDEMIAQYDQDLVQSLPELYPEKPEREIIETVIIPEFRIQLAGVLSNFQKKRSPDLPPIITSREVSEICEKIDAMIVKNKDHLYPESYFKKGLGMIGLKRREAKKRLELNFYEDCKNTLATKGVVNRNSLLMLGSRLFQDKEFEKYGDGKSFFSLILGRPVNKITLKDHNEIADILGFTIESKENEEKAGKNEQIKPVNGIVEDNERKVLETLRTVDIDALTGIEALNLIARLKESLFRSDKKAEEAEVKLPEQKKATTDKGSSDKEDTVLDNIAFADMPFSLLTRDTSGIYEIPLSSDGRKKAVCLNPSEYGFPNSLAPRILFGLMEFWTKENSDKDEYFEFKIRDLVTHYMYPGRFTEYAPNSDLIQATEKQINCIVNLRFDTANNTSGLRIIDDVNVIEEGGRNRARILRIKWGKVFYESMIQGAAKPIDINFIQRIGNPIDLQLYRVLNNALSVKPRQTYPDIISFARYTLGMQGETLDRGGRTACSYIAKNFEKSINRLNQNGFKICMSIDDSDIPFKVIFESETHNKEKSRKAAY